MYFDGRIFSPGARHAESRRRIFGRDAGAVTHRRRASQDGGRLRRGGAGERGVGVEARSVSETVER